MFGADVHRACALQVPYLGDPDESLFPPSKGVGDNMNATREREEAMHTLLLDAVFEDDAVRSVLSEGWAECVSCPCVCMRLDEWLSSACMRVL